MNNVTEHEELPMPDRDQLFRKNNGDITTPIYRYKFTNEFTDELYKFAKIHQYDHRHDFKDAWNVWTEDNADLVNDEIQRLTQLRYDGDILDKMFKSARYYFRKKSTAQKEPAKRRVYVGSHKDLLEAMDVHILECLLAGEFKPSSGFEDFCKQNADMLKDQVALFVRANITDPDEIKYKIKKTYKNRYFSVIRK